MLSRGNPIISEIVEQHAGDAAFLWCLRDAATDQPHYALRDLADLEERIEAHIDGLRVAGEAGVEFAWANLEQYRGMGELFAISTLVLESGGRAGIERVLQFAESVPESLRGFAGAIGWVPPAALRGQAVTWLEASSPFRRLIGIIACSVHRVDPGARLDRLLADDAPLVRARALRLAGELGRVDLQGRARMALGEEDQACRFWAAWSSGILGERTLAIPVLQKYVAADGPFRWDALDIVLRLMDKEAAIGWLRDLNRDPNNARLLVVGAGILGDPVVVPWLIQKMSIPALARVAGESFSMITGIDLSEQRLDGTAPKEFTSGPTDEPSDENTAVEADENLPWPDYGKVQARWEKEQEHFAKSVRHLSGIPLTPDTCMRVLRHGRQRQRRAAAYDLTLTRAGSTLWNWRARADVQARSLNESS